MKLEGSKFLLGLLLLCLLPVVAAASDSQDDELKISRITVEGNKRIPTDTILTYVTLEPGDRYDERLLRNDFRALWNTGFFSNLRILRSEPKDGEVAVTIVVEERPLLREVIYEGLKAVSKGDIDKKIEETPGLEINLDKGKPLDLAEVAKMMGLIRDLMEEKGLEFGDVTYELREAGPIEVDLAFIVHEGGKVKIKEVRFVGNNHFSQWDLTKVLKKSRPTWIFSWVQKDNIYSSKLLQEDLFEVEKFYADHGYLRVNVKEPIIEPIGEDNISVIITVPLSEGQRYRINKIHFSGNKLMPESLVRMFYKKVKEGGIYSRKAIEKGSQELKDIYYSRGYIDAFIQDRIVYVPDKPGYVDLEINIREGDLYTVNKIEFEGNRTTRDKVIRRNIYVYEQQPFNIEALKDSLRRLNQLGFFGSVEPDLKPNPQDKTVDIKIRLTETGRNQIQFGGGYSGLEGAFVNFAFSTSNFWGQGQTLSFMVQTGGRNENYEVSFFDPWLFDKPLGAGVTFFSREFQFNDFVRKGQGGRLNFSYRLARFLSSFLEYRYELIEIRNPADFAFTSSIFFPEGRTATASVTPTIVHNTVDNPLLSTRGHRQTVSFEYGSPVFGGDISFMKLKLEDISHFPLTPRNVLRFRAQVGYAWLLGGAEELPVFERFFMGGEYTIRGYELRTVGPRDQFGRVIGGTSSLLFNFEYMFLLTPEIRIVPFVDLGNAYEGKIDINDLQYSAGVEMRFLVPVMNVPFRFIIAHPINPKEYHRTSAFRFTIGTNF